MKKILLQSLMICSFGLLFAITLKAEEYYNKSPVLPNPELTPGDIDENSTKDKICTVGYTKQVRHVSLSVKNKIFELYKLDKTADNYEIDHLISLELGGSNDIKNLWPQSYDTHPFNAHDKDRLENKLHKMVCNDEISLEEAQKAISSNWLVAFKKYVGGK